MNFNILLAKSPFCFRDFILEFRGILEQLRRISPPRAKLQDHAKPNANQRQ